MCIKDLKLHAIQNPLFLNFNLIILHSLSNKHFGVSRSRFFKKNGRRFFSKTLTLH